MEAITITESKRFVELEAIIKRGKKVFVEVGLALAEIRDKELWRVDYNSFEAYCKKKWDFGKSYASRLIESAAVVQSVASQELPIGNKIQTESQARALAKVEPSKRAEVLEKAASNGKVTARSIAEAACDCESLSGKAHRTDCPELPHNKPTPPEVRQTPVVEVPAEVAFVEKEEDRLSAGKTAIQTVIEDAERIIALLKAIDDPCPFDDPMDLDELAEGFNECARGLRAIAKQEAA